MASTLTVMVPEGDPQAEFVLATVALNPPAVFTVIVSILVSCTEGSLQAEKMVLTMYLAEGADEQTLGKVRSRRPGVELDVLAKAI